jgi:poly(beta-D-mannuronate) lyase
MVIGEPFRPLAPIDITIANNIIKSDSGRLVNYRAGTNITWKDNILFGSATKGNMPTTGYTWIDPKLVLQGDDVYRILNTSPAIDKANTVSFPDIVKDMDGQTRSGLLDTGADEFRTESIINFPLSPVHVGPNSY